jgi:hypothetical protein
MWKLSAEQKSEICIRYQNGENSEKLSFDFDVTPVAITGILKRRGVSVRSQNEAQKKYALDEAAFDEINEDSAYWVGFLMADGCILETGTSSPEIRLVLSEKDREHIEKFKTFLGSTHKISIQKPRGYIGSKPSVRLSIYSQGIADALSKYGVVSNKTKRTKVSLLEYNRHFWRGVVDGDGWVGVSKDGYFRLDLVGSRFLLEQFVAYVKSICPNSPISVRPHKGIFRVGLGGSTAFLVASNLYYDAAIALPRKANVVYSFSF